MAKSITSVRVSGSGKFCFIPCRWESKMLIPHPIGALKPMDSIKTKRTAHTFYIYFIYRYGFLCVSFASFFALCARLNKNCHEKGTLGDFNAYSAIGCVVRICSRVIIGTCFLSSVDSWSSAFIRASCISLFPHIQTHTLLFYLSSMLFYVLEGRSNADKFYRLFLARSSANREHFQ